jgi:uncharacterized protein (DUF488 family)
MTIYTIGHSTRTIVEFIGLLKAHHIEMLIDIRSFPMSRRLPHFNRENMEKSLADAQIEYLWMKDLGGRRKRELKDSPNVALRNESFRNYADYMLTAQFQGATEKLLQLAAGKRVAIMCAEALYFRCHRMLVSDFLSAHAHEVLHILDKDVPRPHALMREARIIDGRLLYRGDRLL